MSRRATIGTERRAITRALAGVTVVDAPYAGIRAFTPSPTQTWGDTATTIELTNAPVVDVGLSLASNEITVAAAGRMSIVAQVVLDVDVGASPVLADVWVEIAGFEVAGTRRANLRLDSFAGPQEVAISLQIGVTAGQAVRIRSQRTAGVSDVVLKRAALVVERKTNP